MGSSQGSFSIDTVFSPFSLLLKFLVPSGFNPYFFHLCHCLTLQFYSFLVVMYTYDLCFTLGDLLLIISHFAAGTQVRKEVVKLKEVQARHEYLLNLTSPI
jgi:hypothetical protein